MLSCHFTAQKCLPLVSMCMEVHRISTGKGLIDSNTVNSWCKSETEYNLLLTRQYVRYKLPWWSSRLKQSHLCNWTFSKPFISPRCAPSWCCPIYLFVCPAQMSSIFPKAGLFSTLLIISVMTFCDLVKLCVFLCVWEEGLWELIILQLIRVDGMNNWMCKNNRRGEFVRTMRWSSRGYFISRHAGWK